VHFRLRFQDLGHPCLGFRRLPPAFLQSSRAVFRAPHRGDRDAEYDKPQQHGRGGKRLAEREDGVAEGDQRAG
jgi:hypothetical protein